jgi:RNA polymerase sigma-70 factor (ECF subfamily)
MAPLAPNLTHLLHAWSRGDASALERLVPLVFEDLRRMARRHLRGERASHTLQPTALVNEVYLKLMDQREPDWQNREHFFAIAARIMRRVLLDYGKARQTSKRGGDVVKIPLDVVFGLAADQSGDLAALSDALARLAEIDPRQARIVELRYLFGFEHEEIGKILNISATTSKREWATARLWLHRELRQE